MKISARPTIPRLTSNGDLVLYFVGAGSAFAKTLNQNNLLVTKADSHVLIDCGARCPKALFDAGLPPGKIDNYLITHSHADHIGGLEEAQLSGRYVTRRKPRMVINRAYEKILWEQSLRGGSERSEGGTLGFRDFWDVIRPQRLKGYPRETWEADVGAINLKLPRTKHFPDSARSWRDSAWSCGVIIDDRVLYTSDTRFDPDLLLAYEDKFRFDVIMHDCQFFTGGVHASLDELGTLPRTLREKIVLMHYGDNWRDYTRQARRAGFHSFAREGHTYRFC